MLDFARRLHESEVDRLRLRSQLSQTGLPRGDADVDVVEELNVSQTQRQVPRALIIIIIIIIITRTIFIVLSS